MTQNETREPPYYAKDGRVWKRPIHTKQPDGSTNISLGFPVCEMSDAVGDDAADTVAALMNAGHAALAAKELADGQ